MNRWVFVGQRDGSNREGKQLELYLMVLLESKIK